MNLTCVNSQEIFEVKGRELAPEEIQDCERFLAGSEVSSPYLDQLYQVFIGQLKHKLGLAVGEVSIDFLDHRVQRLMTAFLKEKLGKKGAIEPEYELVNRAQFDPHSHARAFFTTLFPEARYHLPDFEEAYAYLRPHVKAIEEKRDEVIREIMEQEASPPITEVGCSYDHWHYEHHGKRIVPILAYTTDRGHPWRKDVTGYDYCGQASQSETGYQSVKTLLEGIEEGQMVRLHMGETVSPEKGRDHITQCLNEADLYYRSSKPLRIGHGTHISLDDMKRIASRGYYIEACLSSNKKTGILGKRSEYPLGIMLLLGVKVVIGTDGAALYSTSLALEYAYAARSLKKFCELLEGSDDLITLPNGDRLCVRHVSHLFKSDLPILEGDSPLTYRQLGESLKEEIFQWITPDQLVENAQSMLVACYDN